MDNTSSKDRLSLLPCCASSSVWACEGRRAWWPDPCRCRRRRRWPCSRGAQTVSYQTSSLRSRRRAFWCPWQDFFRTRYLTSARKRWFYYYKAFLILFKKYISGPLNIVNFIGTLLLQYSMSRIHFLPSMYSKNRGMQ